MVSSKANADLCFRKSPRVAQGRITAKGITLEKMDLYPSPFVVNSSQTRMSFRKCD